MNVMAVSTLTPDAMDTFLLKLAGSGVHNVAIVDSSVRSTRTMFATGP